MLEFSHSEESFPQEALRAKRDLKKLSRWFPHLHQHTNYSFYDGLINVVDLVSMTKDWGGEVVCSTDHGNMCASIQLYNETNRHKMRCITGMEAYLNDSREKLLDFVSSDHKEMKKDERAEIRKNLSRRYHTIILPITRKGYYNAIKVHNNAWEHYYQYPLTTSDLIFEHNDGLIVTTACIGGQIPQALVNGDEDAATRYASKFKEVLGQNRFFFELSMNLTEGQRELNSRLIKLGRKLGISFVMGNDNHYRCGSSHHAHTVMMAMNTDRNDVGLTIEDLKKGSSYISDLYIKSTVEMWMSWLKIHQSDEFTEDVFWEAYDNNVKITNMVEPYDLHAPPTIPIPKHIKEPAFFIKDEVIRGLQRKNEKGLIPKGMLKDYVDRVKHELNVMKDVNAIDYICVVYDMISWTREQGQIVSPGRGSAAGSLVLWALGITGIDPIKYNLIFERFLNADRKVQMKIDL